MPRPSSAFVVVFAAGLVLLFILASLERRAEAFTLGVAPASPLTVLPGAQVCQRSIDPPAAFDRVRLEVGSKGSRPPVFLARLISNHRVLARDPSSRTIGGRIAVVAQMGEVSTDRPVSFCLRNTGRRALTVYGNVGAAHPASSAFLKGKDIDYDLDLRFFRAEEKTMLSLAGEIVSRAALFRGEWIRPWGVWLVAVLLIIAFPLLLVRGLRAVED